MHFTCDDFSRVKKGPNAALVALLQASGEASEISLPSLGVTVSSKPGRLLLFETTLPDGSCDPAAGYSTVRCCPPAASHLHSTTSPTCISLLSLSCTFPLALSLHFPCTFPLALPLHFPTCTFPALSLHFPCTFPLALSLHFPCTFPLALSHPPPTDRPLSFGCRSLLPGMHCYGDVRLPPPDLQALTARPLWRLVGRRRWPRDLPILFSSRKCSTRIGPTNETRTIWR